MNEPLDAKQSQRDNFSLLRVLVGVFVGLTIVAWLLIPCLTIPQSRADRIRCLANLRALTLALSVHADRHGGAYPPPNVWCDIIVREFGQASGDIKAMFRCPKGGKGPCDYAMNPQADPNSAPDTILLFECDGGWNQSGGPGLLTTEHHDDKGCCVSFVNGRVKFVEAVDLDKLRWRPSDGSERMVAPEVVD